MTGRYAIRAGLGYKVVGARSEHGLPDSEETLAELAARAGYRSALIGKWHLGRLPLHSPLQHGFDEFYGVPHSNDMPEFVLYDGDRIIDSDPDQSQLTRAYTERAVEFIDSNSGQPFLLVISHTFPHIPLYASAAFRGRSDAGIYGDTVEELDWSTGEVVAALRRAGIEDNTLIVFTSDNGPFFEGSSGGLRGGKGNSWEGGYRVPFIATWPAVIEPGRTSDAMVMNIDLLPTLADLTGLSPLADTIDGRSLAPLFNGGDESGHDYLYFFNNETIVGLRTQRWKLVTHRYYTTSLGAFEKFDRLPGFEAAYDLLLDPAAGEAEAYSYADRYPDTMKRLRRQLQIARQHFEPLRTRPPDPTYPP